MNGKQAYNAKEYAQSFLSLRAHLHVMRMLLFMFLA